MDIKELKSLIELKTLDEDFMIWLIEDEQSEIIADQYIKLIVKNKNLNVKYIEDMNEIPDESFIEDDNLYIIKTEKWESPDRHNNCIVVCNKTKNPDAVKFPKLQDWQVIDYVIPKLSGLSTESIEWLLSQYSGNYMRFINDIESIAIFSKGLQTTIFNEMLEDGQFDTLTSLTIWDLSNAILKKDKRMVKEVLKVIKYIDVSELGLAKVLYTNFKNVMSIQINPKVTAKDLGMTDKQFFVVKKYNTGFYSSAKLVEIMKVLTSTEWLFKYGELPLQDLIDYMICKIMVE